MPRKLIPTPPKQPWQRIKCTTACTICETVKGTIRYFAVVNGEETLVCYTCLRKWKFI